MDNLLILTSCIRPPKQDLLKLIDSKKRYLQTVDCLEFYINSRSFKNIVICDGSDYNLSNESIVKLALENNINLEILYFKQNFEKVRMQGKGYGEGEIMKYIINNSKLYHDCYYITKITGRLKVLNIDIILKRLDLTKTYFNYFPAKKIGCVDTRFFVMSKHIYEKYLINSYEYVNDKSGNSYEYCLTDSLKEYKINPTPFPKVPIFSGYSGTTNATYRKDKFYYLELVLTKIGLMNSKFCAYLLLALNIYDKIILTLKGRFK